MFNWIRLALIGHLIPMFGFSFADEGGEGAGEGQGAGTAPVSNWKDSIPADIKADPLWEKYKEPADAYRALLGSQKFLGREKLPVPKDANDKETYDLIYKALGRPESADGYVLPTDFQVPKELPMDEGRLMGFRKKAHELGLLPHQFSGLYKWEIENAVNGYNKFNEQKTVASQDAENALRTKWGAAYQQNIALAKKTFQSFADEKAFAEFEKGFGNNPVLIEFFANIGKVMSEDQLSGKPQGLTLTPIEAQAEINKIKGDMKHPYWNAESPAHREALDQMERLMQLVESGA